MSRLILNTGIIFVGMLVGTSVYALGPPGSAYNGGTGIGIDNFYQQLPVTATPAAQQKEQETQRDQQVKANNYPRYVNVTKIPVSFTPSRQ
jgi:hypothetical protein